LGVWWNNDFVLGKHGTEQVSHHLREFGVLEQESQVSMHDIAANDMHREYQGQTGSVQR
jgi:hypothetical protein